MGFSAKVETTFDDGSPCTMRCEYGCRWRVEVDAADGTLAVAQIHDSPRTDVDSVETVGMTPCAVATWERDGTLWITTVSSHGENSTDPSEYEDGSGVMIATPNGWEPKDE